MTSSCGGDEFKGAPAAATIFVVIALLGLGILCRVGEARPVADGPAVGNLIFDPQFKVAAAVPVPVGWSVWSPRLELAPVATVVAANGGNQLSLRATRFEEYGAWRTLVRAIKPGSFYRFQVFHRDLDVAADDVSVGVILTWCKSEEGQGELQRDYADSSPADPKGWRCDERTLRAPAAARSVSIELLLRSTAHGTVVFKSPSLIEVAAPVPRTARIVTTHLDPARPPSIEANTRLMLQMMDKTAEQHPDLVLFSENFVDRFLTAPFIDRAQPVPGPLTQALGEKALRYHTYVVTTLHEIDHGLVYNTAVLIDRDGHLVGKYRKVHLALAESEGGLTPGSEYPVFQTDFGRIGILTCWDNWFSEPVRVLRLKGAEILLFPLAGDGVPGHYDVITRARALDNGMYVVASPTLNGVPARIINPAGEILSEANGPFGFATAQIDLNQEWRTRYLSVASGDGEAKSLYVKERRPDTYGEISDPDRSDTSHK